jgi:catalase
MIGKLTLNRNPVNYFAETEQVAFHLGNLVPGIEVTNDPLLQARLFSYLETQHTPGGPVPAEQPRRRAPGRRLPRRRLRPGRPPGR